MSTDSEWQDSCDDEPDIDSYQCYVSITRLTDEEIERWTNPALVNSANNNSLTTIDHNYSVSSITYDSDATTVEDFDISRPEGSVKKTETDGPSSLYDDDEIISIELDKGTKKKVQIYDKCTIPDKLVSRYNSLKKRYSSTLPLFCLFCLKEYNQVNQVLSCHYQQAKHFPFRCVECEESTLDTKGMIQHYTKTHPTLTRVQYRRSFAPAKERWASKFVIYQLKCITNQAIMIPNGILHKYCPVCNQWDYKLGDKYPKNKPQHKLYTVLDKNHIHKHLKYHPFQCLLCLKKNVRCDFTVVNKKARLHLINRHGYSAPTEQDLKDNFDSLGMIPELERYINSYVKFVQESFTRQTFRLSPIADTSSQTPKKILSTPPSSASTKQSTPLSILSGGKKSGSSGKASKAISKLTTGKKRRHEYSIDDMYYPSPKYARRDYSRPKNGKKSQITDSSVIDLDSFYEDSSNPYLKPDQAPRIVCIFCNYQVTDILAAWDHYATHLDYRPITCQLCHKSFPGPKAFQLHGSDHVDHDNLPYTWHHDEIIEGWSRDFLNSIINDTNANPEFACFCPICSKKFQKQEVSLQKLPYEDVRKHIFSHLRYQPYHCNLCTGDRFFVADLDNEGVRHLTFHEIICSREELPNHFTRSRGIEAVDSFLMEHFKKIRQLFNTPNGNTSTDGNVSNDPLCDVESLFNSLQETLGHNTLNNILDNVSNSEDRPSDQNEPAIDYPCTPTSTTSDPVTASSPVESYQLSLPPSPIKPIATVTNESSDTMIPSASESSTSAKSSPSQESPMDVIIIPDENQEKIEAKSLKEPQFVDNEKLNYRKDISKDAENNQVDSVKIIVENKSTEIFSKLDETRVLGGDEKVDGNSLEEPQSVNMEKLDDEKKISEETEDSQMIVDIQDDLVENKSTDNSTKQNETVVTEGNEKQIEASSLKEPEFVNNEKLDDEKKISEETEDSQMMVDIQDDLVENKSTDNSTKQNETVVTEGNEKQIEASSLKEPEFVKNEKLDDEKKISEEAKDNQMMVDIQDDLVKSTVEKKSTDISPKSNEAIVPDGINEKIAANSLEEPQPLDKDNLDDEKSITEVNEDDQIANSVKTVCAVVTDIQEKVESEKLDIESEKVHSDGQRLETESKKVDSEKVDCEKIDSEQIDAENVNCEKFDSKKVDIDSEKVHSDGQKLETESKKVDSEKVDCEKIDAEQIDAENVNCEKFDSKKVDIDSEKVHSDGQKLETESEKVDSEKVDCEKIDFEEVDAEKMNTESDNFDSPKVETNSEKLQHDHCKEGIKQEKVHSDDKKVFIKSEKVDSSTETTSIKLRKLHLDNEKVVIKKEIIHSDPEKLNVKNSNASKRNSTGPVKAGTRKMPVRKGKAIVENKSTNTSPKPPEIKEIKLRRKTIVSTGTPSSRTRSKTTKVTTATQTRSF